MFADSVRNCEVNDKFFTNTLSAIRNIKVSAWQRELLFEMTWKNFGLNRIVRNVEVSTWQRCPQREVLLYIISRNTGHEIH
jgi:hypothetical protein